MTTSRPETPGPADGAPVPRADAPSPYVFVVGCPRSGTTLLQRMLDNHPLLAVANDTHFIPKAISSRRASPDTPLTQDMIEAVRGYRRFPRLGVSDEEVARAVARSGTYAGFVGALYRAFAAGKGKPLGGEKTPDYVRRVPMLSALFPRARFVHIIRDGREVALSTAEWAHERKGPGRFALWQDEPYAVCALWWAWQVGTGRRDGAALGDTRYLELRYERLVARPEVHLRRAARFLGLAYADEMARYYEGRTRSAPGLSAKKAWLPPVSGLRDWREQMPAPELELFEALAGDLLTTLGYPRAVRSVSAPIRRRAERCRAWWEREMSRRRAA